MVHGERGEGLRGLMNFLRFSCDCDSLISLVVHEGGGVRGLLNFLRLNWDCGPLIKCFRMNLGLRMNLRMYLCT